MIRVLLADDQQLIREALAALLGLEVDLEIVGQVGSGDEVLGAGRPVEAGRGAVGCADARYFAG